MLNRLVYFSERACDEAELARIVAKSALRNKDAQVTGLLLADERSFIQILEGPRGAVSAIFQDVCRDPRHRAPTLVEVAEIGQLSYPRWGMAAVTDPAKIEAAWARVMRAKVEPWPLSALQLRGLLKIALGDARPAPALAPIAAAAAAG